MMGEENNGHIAINLLPQQGQQYLEMDGNDILDLPKILTSSSTIMSNIFINLEQSKTLKRET